MASLLEAEVKVGLRKWGGTCGSEDSWGWRFGGLLLVSGIKHKTCLRRIKCLLLNLFEKSQFHHMASLHVNRTCCVIIGPNRCGKQSNKWNSCTVCYTLYYCTYVYCQLKDLCAMCNTFRLSFTFIVSSLSPAFIRVYMSCRGAVTCLWILSTCDVTLWRAGWA